MKAIEDSCPNERDGNRLKKARKGAEAQRCGKRWKVMESDGKRWKAIGSN
ncbi:hypothetical protein FHS86_000615 [Roseimarinus sediminis]